MMMWDDFGNRSALSNLGDAVWVCFHKLIRKLGPKKLEQNGT